MTLKWQDRIGAVAGFLKLNWLPISAFVVGLIVGGMIF